MKYLILDFQDHPLLMVLVQELLEILSFALRLPEVYTKNETSYWKDLGSSIIGLVFFTKNWCIIDISIFGI